MLRLSESIRQNDPSMQAMMETVENAPRLTEMVLAAWRLGLALAAKVVTEELGQRAARPTAWPACPHCGLVRLWSKGLVRREMKTLLGKIVWWWRTGRCPRGCKIGQTAPLDEALGLVPYQRTSFELQQLACLSAVFLPFETAAHFVQRFTRVSVSAAAIWGWVQDFGQRAQARLARELEQLEAGQLPAEEPLDEQTAAQALLIGADGVMVPYRRKAGSPKGKIRWREVKVAVLARLGQHTTRTGQTVSRLEQRRLVAVLGDIDALSPRLWLEALRQGLRSAKLVAWLSDGGRGFWRLYAERFAAHATGILDFYHAAQNLWKGTAAWLDGRTKRAHTGFAGARHQLRHGQAEEVLADIAAALDLDGLPTSAYETLTKLYAYLDKHRAHIDYQKFKALGLPLGSGLVESACKWLIQQRFKGVGMRWSEEGFNYLLHQRLDWVNGRFDDLFHLRSSPNF